MEEKRIIAEAAEKILVRVREQILSRGAKTIRGLGRVFRQLDSFDGNRKVSKEEFYIGLKEIQLDIEKCESETLMTYLDTNGDGCINFDEFLKGIRGVPNARRQSMVDKAFLKFDKDCSGEITSLDLKGVYDCSFHPKVKTGEMTDDEVYFQFLNNFNDHNKDGKIQKVEWDDYYAAVSASIDNDDHFVLMMKKSWKLE